MLFLLLNNKQTLCAQRNYIQCSHLFVCLMSHFGNFFFLTSYKCHICFHCVEFKFVNWIKQNKQKNSETVELRPAYWQVGLFFFSRRWISNVICRRAKRVREPKRTSNGNVEWHSNQIYIDYIEIQRSYLKITTCSLILVVVQKLNSIFNLQITNF